MSSSPFRLLDQKLRSLHALTSISGLLEWDEQVNLPADSRDLRQEQLAVLARLAHQAQTDPELGELLDQLESGSLDEDQSVVVREARKQYDRAVRLPTDWVERRSRLSSEAYHAWADARRESDFSAFAPFLQQHIDLAKEGAGHLGWDERPYDLMIDLHDPGVDAVTIERLFDELQSELAPLARTAFESRAETPADLFKGFPIAEQRDFLEEVTAALGFNYRRGRMDVSLHPFCSGNGADIRMTTRFDPDNPLDSLFSSIHEAGHGLYEQGLPSDRLHNALGQSAGMGVHESQSRLWENQVCRSRAFWRHYEPKLRDRFPKQLSSVSSDELYRAINAIGRKSIRVDADEIHYNLHIIIRFEIEKRLFTGELPVSKAPAYWNERYAELIGIEPSNDAEGILQDVHWSGGAFGYFPSYCLGNMLAAQLWYAALDSMPDLESDFSEGRFDRLLTWLRERVHQQGARYPLLRLAEVATGQPLSPQPLLRYLRERYLPLCRAGA